MSTMGCNEFLAQLEPWMEGERHSAAEAHVQGCASCRSFVADLNAIQVSASILVIADPEPPGRVWNALRSQLLEEGLIRDWVETETATAAKQSWFGGLFAFVPRPALAGAYLALLVLVGFGLSTTFVQQTPQTLSFPLAAELDHAEQTTVSSFDSSKSPVSTDLHQNLEIIDHYIALCEKSVREEPQNDAAREYLYQAYEQKADLLNMITERGDVNQ